MKNQKVIYFGTFSVLAVAIIVFLSFQNSYMWHTILDLHEVEGDYESSMEIMESQSKKPQQNQRQKQQQPKHQSQEDLPNYTRTVEDVGHLGYQKVVYSHRHDTSDSKGSILVASSIANENSFGNTRNFGDFYDVIGSLEYEQRSLSLSFYCGSAVLFEMATAFLDDATSKNKFPYKRATLLYAPFLQTTFRSSEHDPKVQTKRRRSIASGRNFVLLNSILSEEFILFFDADIIRLDHPDMLTRFVGSGKDIVVPRIERGSDPDYDRNSWRGHRIVPSETQLQLMDEDKWADADWEPRDGNGETFHLKDHLDDIKDRPQSDKKRDLNYLIDLDSVGGAVLFLKSIIIKIGIVFPTYNAVGTAWSRKEGYDGIETEGLCYAARTMGFSCHAMPNLVAQHSI